MTGKCMAAHRLVYGEIAARRLRTTRKPGRRWWWGCRPCGLSVSRLIAACYGEQKQEQHSPACGPAFAQAIRRCLVDHSQNHDRKTRHGTGRTCWLATLTPAADITSCESDTTSSDFARTASTSRRPLPRGGARVARV